MLGKISVHKITLIALAIVINIVGSYIALGLHLPIYLDSMGTIMTAILLGPFYGLFPGVLSALITGMTSDIYALYYMPVGIVLGVMTGFVFQKNKSNKLFVKSFCISVPASLISACITAIVFGGITSSGSTMLVQLLAKTPLGLMLSCLIVQFFTDYFDRLLSLWLVFSVIKKLPDSFIKKLEH
ncbi:ECF transporter S component [Faecalitalea cylindroides]|uniref:ECF transporter S component n=1 Tax=Faecalitalea cylindroides TaxID=39483 RepID=UPI002330B8AA|nr:ECF transporter S component [Faecalitalea cylindroides]MDB7953042.1 ECF transporter S component [Faecalitalea cylindroides]MDB7959379.1 ECF transporter S component [Faecalitalea cylindroides]MDB7961183.1 ECF transporter S component [Faecalitalea cylindroides]MDB7963644.1 ECF transporter S component [Faecalitalea cylindroides]MDB7965145.1 ECF transporter S component [Faecalitalea cylindroides]